MQFQSFALAIVNDLFDEDLDPDLFEDEADEADEARAGLMADGCDGSLDDVRQAKPPHGDAPYRAQRLT